MAIRQFFVVTVEFAGAAPFIGDTQSSRMMSTRNVRLVESREGAARKFTLFDGDAPEYTLSVDESAQLEQLLGEIDMKVPWKSQAGFDGTDYELKLQGAMSSVTFRWWVDVPAGWERVGAVFDYVVTVADSCRAG